MFKTFRYLNKRQWSMIGFAVIFIVAQVWLDLKLPDYMSEITTLVETDGSSMSDILVQGGYMMLCALGSMAASMSAGYFTALVAAGLAHILREGVYDRTLHFSMAQISRFSTSSLINRTTNDITQIQNFVGLGLQAIIKAPIMAVWAIVKICNKSWQWTAAAAGAVAVLVVILSIVMFIAVPRFRRIQNLTDRINRIIREYLTGIRVIRAYNAEKYQENKFDKENKELVGNNLTANRVMAVMSPGMTLINSGLTLAVYWIGAYLIENAAVSMKLPLFSDMVVFSNYAMQIIMAFMMLNMVFIMLPRGQVAAKRVLEVINTENSIADGTYDSSDETGNPRRGEVEFRNVSFRYPGNNHDTVSDISFTAERGRTTAIIGATGSGKTTLIDLIPRFYDVQKGQVLVDGRDVKEYTGEALHGRIGYISQKAVLFSGTVRSNVMYGGNNAAGASERNLRGALEISRSSEFVEGLEEKENSHVAQGGTNFSGGQKQRISIARAIASDPEILIFDDSFSALDYKTDAALRKELDEKVKDTTKIIVAQRISTIRGADQIIVLDKGKIAGRGTHKELMANCPVYQEIAASQLSRSELAS